MGFSEWVGQRLAKIMPVRVTEAIVATPLKEAITLAANYGDRTQKFLGDYAKEDATWGGSILGSGNSGFRFEQAVRKSRALNIRNGIYGTVMEAMINLVVGDGIVYEAKDEELKEWLMRDVIELNRLDEIKDREDAEQFYVDGEIAIPLHASGFSSDVYFGSCLDPLMIQCLKVEDGNDRAIRFAIVSDGMRSYPFQVCNGVSTISTPTGNLWLDKQPDFEGVPVQGKILFYQLKKPGVGRGVPWLYRGFATLENYGEFVYEEIRRAKGQAGWFPHVAIDGFDPDAMDQKTLEKYREVYTPKHGRVLITDTTAKVDTKAYSLGSGSEQDSNFRERIAAELNIPPIWLALSDANKSTSDNQVGQFQRGVMARQGQFKCIRRDQIHVAMKMAQAGGWLSSEYTIDDISIQMPQVSAKDMVMMGQALNLAISGIMSGIDSGAYTEESGLNAIRELTQQLTDAELDPLDEGEMPEGDVTPGDVSRFEQARRQVMGDE